MLFNKHIASIDNIVTEFKNVIKTLPMDCSRSELLKENALRLSSDIYELNVLVDVAIEAHKQMFPESNLSEFSYNFFMMIVKENPNIFSENKDNCVLVDLLKKLARYINQKDSFGTNIMIFERILKKHGLNPKDF